MTRAIVLPLLLAAAACAEEAPSNEVRASGHVEATDVRLAPEVGGRIVTLGIRPTYPAESFGYIQRGEPFPTPGESSLSVYRAKQFREKPVAAVAQP